MQKSMEDQDDIAIMDSKCNQTKEQPTDWEKEERHLQECVGIIQCNIDDYQQKHIELSKETKELYDNYRSDNPELHNDLVIGIDIMDMMKRILNKNRIAIKKPYFGRIDYMEEGDGEEFILYLGKNGIRKGITQNLIVDWRSPISSVYYDSDIGKSSYQTPFGDSINIQLNRKRTYEISDSKLIDFYDTDVVANDEFLTKYLSKNKEVVLGEIIATIQKEQNLIIRDTPWHNVIVQGVAGSGKTTVAMHRISYILYNYKEKFRPDEFYIIGSNQMLLNYITGVLPNLDVYNVNQMTMERFLLTLLDHDFNLKKGGYTLNHSFYQQLSKEDVKEISELKKYKGSIHFIRALTDFMKQFEQEEVKPFNVEYQNKLLFSREDILYYLNFFQGLPLQEKIDQLNKRLKNKIVSINEEQNKPKEEIKKEVKKYENYFGNRNKKYNLMDIYLELVKYLQENRLEYGESKNEIPSIKVRKRLLLQLQSKNIDLYDLGMLTLIKKNLKQTKDFEYISHIIIDEAQDFGVMLFYLMKRLFENCTYTIMGDVSQNIHYDSGMNDWEILKNEVFSPEKDRFYVLAKSYRNTVEISEFASRVLRKCTFQTYDIEPIIRHGKEVVLLKAHDEQQMAADTIKAIHAIKEAGYDTIAVICRSDKDMNRVRELLKTQIDIINQEENMEEMIFQSGVMILPIHMTKGLEFDAVILWNADENNYRDENQDAKLLYVAITRALHELYIMYQGNLSGLLQ